jgi:hypothetical protein
MQVLFARFGEGVKPRSSVVVGRAPLGTDPALLFESLKGRIKGTVIDQQGVVGLSLDTERDAVTVLRSENKRAKDQ